MHETQNEQHKTQKEENYMDLRNMWMVEWSEKQGWFHVGNIDEMIGKNIRAYIDGQTTDYAIVGIVESEDEAAKLIQLLEAERKAPIPDPLSDFLLTQSHPNSEIKSVDLPPLATAARKNGLKRTPLGDGREIISLKRR